MVPVLSLLGSCEAVVPPFESACWELVSDGLDVVVPVGVDGGCVTVWMMVVAACAILVGCTCDAVVALVGATLPGWTM